MDGVNDTGYVYDVTLPMKKKLRQQISRTNFKYLKEVPKVTNFHHKKGRKG
jgi:hypothetical protein